MEIEDKPVEPWLSVADVCRILQVGTKKVGGWIESRMLVAMDVGFGSGRPKYRICPDSVDTLKTALMVTPLRKRGRPSRHRISDASTDQ